MLLAPLLLEILCRGEGGGVFLHNQEMGLKANSGVSLESKPILINHTGLRVAHQRLLVEYVFLKPVCSFTVCTVLGKQFAVYEKVYHYKSIAVF